MEREDPLAKYRTPVSYFARKKPVIMRLAEKSHFYLSEPSDTFIFLVCEKVNVFNDIKMSKKYRITFSYTTSVYKGCRGKR